MRAKPSRSVSGREQWRRRRFSWREQSARSPAMDSWSVRTLPFRTSSRRVSSRWPATRSGADSDRPGQLDDDHRCHGGGGVADRDRRASAHFKGVDFAGKTGSAQTISNKLKAKMGASEKSEVQGQLAGSWASRPAEIREIVVAVLLEERRARSLAARAAAQVIKAYVEKQRAFRPRWPKPTERRQDQAGRSRRGLARGRRQESRQGASRPFHGHRRRQDRSR